MDGKGSKSRITDRKAFRDGWDKTFSVKREKDPEKDRDQKTQRENANEPEK